MRIKNFPLAVFMHYLKNGNSVISYIFLDMCQNKDGLETSPNVGIVNDSSSYNMIVKRVEISFTFAAPTKCHIHILLQSLLNINDSKPLTFQLTCKCWILLPCMWNKLATFSSDTQL